MRSLRYLLPEENGEAKSLLFENVRKTYNSGGSHPQSTRAFKEGETAMRGRSNQIVGERPKATALEGICFRTMLPHT